MRQQRNSGRGDHHDAVVAVKEVIGEISYALSRCREVGLQGTVCS